MEFNSDEILLKDISRGKKEAFDLLFRKYYHLLRNYANRLLKDQTQAEDVLQEIFFRLWVKRSELEQVKNISSYIKSAVHNECISIIRKKLKFGTVTIEETLVYESENIYHDIIQYQETIIDKELALLIGNAINKLSDHCKTVFILSRSFGFKNKEIANHLDISVKTVEKHITKALQILREELKDYLPLLAFFLFSR